MSPTIALTCRSRMHVNHKGICCGKRAQPTHSAALIAQQPYRGIDYTGVHLHHSGES
ncbi:MAG: hypothetical protein JNK66_14845 [Chitinophagales bacterium]|nr:hypothetical protein [Chitinophagales bacterium]